MYETFIILFSYVNVCVCARACMRAQTVNPVCGC